MMFNVQGRPRQVRFAIIGAGVAAFAAIILFLLRPDPAEMQLPEEEAPAPAEQAPPVERSAMTYGQLVCQVDRNRGRITVSAGEDTALTITPDGCVNGRTQYARGPDGRWTRTLVPEEDATITRLAYDPVTGIAETRRYFLSLEAMEAARRQRAAINVERTCTTDPERLQSLAARENALATLLPAQPSEQIFSQCALAVDAVGAGTDAGASAGAAPNPRKP